jgi:hypothetical protein
MRDDLSAGVHKEKPALLKHYISVTIGEDAVTKYVPTRAQLLHERGEKARLTVEEQVTCLIEQATDLNILGRTWCGWQPFI